MPASAALEFDLCKHIYYFRDGRDRRQVCLVDLYRFGVRATGICDASATYVSPFLKRRSIARYLRYHLHPKKVGFCSAFEVFPSLRGRQRRIFPTSRRLWKREKRRPTRMPRGRSERREEHRTHCIGPSFRQKRSKNQETEKSRATSQSSHEKTEKRRGISGPGEGREEAEHTSLRLGEGRALGCKWYLTESLSRTSRPC